MNIKINKLTLQNFKGVRNLEINANGENLTIYGNNATGKTTIFDAFTWLLFGKDSLGRSDFGIKTQDENGEVIHNLEHIVECELAIDNSILALKKIYAEKWTKKRGSSESEFSGHETKHFVNEVPVTKKDYEMKIASIIDETLFKVITNPLYFNEHLKWQDRRAILMSLCENITDENILANNERFLPLNSALKGRTIDEYRTALKSQQNAINNELKAIPQRIAEANLAIPDINSTIDINEKSVIEAEIEELQAKVISVKNGAGVLEADREIADLKNMRKIVEEQTCDTNSLEIELNNAKAKAKAAMFEVDNCTRQIHSFKNSIANGEAETARLREKWHKINEKKYADSGFCPTCGQALPDDMIEKAKIEFNTSKVAELESITEQGKRARAETEYTRLLCSQVEEQLKNAKTEYETAEKEVERISTEIEKTKADFEEKRKDSISAIDSHIEEARKRGVNGEETIKASVYTLEEQIAEKRAKLSEIDRVVAESAVAERQKARIAELVADEKKLAGEYAELAKMEFLVEEFTKFKVQMLSASQSLSYSPI